MIRLEMYKFNFKLNKEGGDVFFFFLDVYMFLCLIIYYIIVINKN